MINKLFYGFTFIFSFVTIMFIILKTTNIINIGWWFIFLIMFIYLLFFCIFVIITINSISEEEKKNE